MWVSAIYSDGFVTSSNVRDVLNLQMGLLPVAMGAGELEYEVAGGAVAWCG